MFMDMKLQRDCMNIAQGLTTSDGVLLRGGMRSPFSAPISLLVRVEEARRDGTGRCLRPLRVAYASAARDAQLKATRRQPVYVAYARAASALPSSASSLSIVVRRRHRRP